MRVFGNLPTHKVQSEHPTTSKWCSMHDLPQFDDSQTSIPPFGKVRILKDTQQENTKKKRPAKRRWKMIAFVLLLLSVSCFSYFYMYSDVEENKRPIQANNIPQDVRNRMRVYDAGDDYINLFHLCGTGHYTIIVLSTPSCYPCEHLWNNTIPIYLSNCPNCVSVKVDISGEDGSVSGHQISVIKELNISGRVAVPVTLVVSPLGVVLGTATGFPQSEQLLENIFKKPIYTHPIQFKQQKPIWDNLATPTKRSPPYKNR